MDRRNMRSFTANLAFALVLLASFSVLFAGAQPSGGVITFNETQTKNASPAEYLNTSGGTFTTLLLYSETQNLKWKAYAGNVSGKLVLDDAQDFSIYQWETASHSGQVYASRNNSVDWSGIGCAQTSQVEAEDTALNHTSGADDSVNSTFSSNIHKTFYVGTELIQNSTCRSTFTWVSDAAPAQSENSPFQEILLYDGNNMVYTTPISDNTVGFNDETYDFQLIVPDRGVAGYAAQTYYFYVELQ